MSVHWDIAIYDRANQLALVVEVKTKLNASPEWAARLRRNIFAHGTYPNAPYFLMVFPDRFYLWKNVGIDQEAVEPTYVIEAQPILQPYFDQSGIVANQVSDQSLELIVASWLGDLVHKSRNDLEPSQDWLIESGLYDAVAGGSLDQKVMA